MAISSQSHAQSAPSHTDGLVVADKWGNVAVVNHTINTVLWGNTGIFVDGISIPDSAAFQPDDVEKPALAVASRTA